MNTRHSEVPRRFKEIQNSICLVLEKADGKGKFVEDSWERPGGGGGRTRVIAGGNIIEKGGVNFSEVYGNTPEYIKQNMQVDEPEFYATGVSIVLHPHNPWVPIIHMNIRMFEMSGGTLWFGGGIDLTPHLVIDEDAKYFHQQLKEICDKHNANYYAEYKKEADDYFYIPHRKETRGIGGIFFDYLKPNAKNSFESYWAFVQDIGEAFADIYTHFMLKNKDLTYSEDEKKWQYLRRGRYTEFNLVWDKGTKFGLQTDGRIESILMSLPPQAAWEYNHKPVEGSAQHYTLSKLVKGINWID
ncbi:oxygen-dependent coproporphyrinogen oxidase [Fulvivirgaceae bacterium LMO-SS25]